MTAKSSYPFYRSLRFRFGLLFNILLLVFLLVIIFLLYNNVKNELEKNFLLRLSSGANNVLQKTEVNPTIIPLPQNGEQFILTYNYGNHTDTLFSNFRIPVNKNDSYKSENWRTVQTSKTLETGGVIYVKYALQSQEYRASIKQLQTLLFIYIPVAIVVSFVAGYFLSGILLQPLHKIIAKANGIDLTNDIKLLDEPVIKDELYELVDALNRMLSRIEKQSQQQNAFFASASHELRTPLSNMLTELQTSVPHYTSPAMQTLVQSQIAEVHRLKELVNNFLLMSQLKADVLTPAESIFSMADLCLDVINQFQKVAKQNHQIFKFEVTPGDADFTVVADTNHMFIIVRNLVENAVKYGLQRSAITLLLRENAKSIFVIIQNQTNALIRDVNDLKNEFSRAESLQEGFGLGLWISNQLAEKNGFQLNLTSHDNTFFAELIVPVKR